MIEGTSSPEEQFMRLAERACQLWGELAHGRVRPVKIRENAVYQITAQSGDRFALRIHRPGYHSDESLLSEYRWMAALCAYGMPTPKLLLSSNDQMFERLSDGVHSYQIDVFEWIDGTAAAFPPGGGNAPLSQILDQYRLMGRAMGLAHSHSRGWSALPALERHRWDTEGLTGENPLWGRFWEYPELDTEQRLLMETVRAVLQRDLTELGTDSESFGLIHADLMPDNVIMSSEGLYVIDFDDAGYGWYFYDIAVSLFSFTKHVRYDRILDAFMDGYRPQNPLSIREHVLLKMFFAARGATLLGWLHSRNQDEARSRAPWLIELACGAARWWLSSRAT